MLKNCLKKMDTLGVIFIRIHNCVFQVGASIDQFEKIFEDLDVKTEELNGALDNVYSTTIDQSEVNGLLQEMKEAHGMEVGEGIQGAQKGSAQMSNAQANDVDEMQKKLDQLKHL